MRLGFDSRSAGPTVENLLHVLGAFAEQRATRTGNGTHNVRAAGPRKPRQVPRLFAGIKSQLARAKLKRRFGIRADALNVYGCLLKSVSVKARALAFLHGLPRFISALDARRVAKRAVDYALIARRETDNPFLSTEAANLKATVAIGFKDHANALSKRTVGAAFDDVHNPIASRRNFPMPFGVGEIVGRRNDDLNLAVVNDEALKGQYADGVPKRSFHSLSFLYRQFLARVGQAHWSDITGTVTVANRPPKSVVGQSMGYGLSRFFVCDFKVDREDKLLHAPIIALRGRL